MLRMYSSKSNKAVKCKEFVNQKLQLNFNLINYELINLIKLILTNILRDRYFFG